MADIGTDFVLRLLKTNKQRDSILVVDCFLKMSYFIPCSKTSDASHVARIFLENIISLHRVLKTIVFKRDIKFTSYFWKTLW